MATKLHFDYKEYKNCPEATGISYARERGKVFHFLFCFLCFFMSLLFCFVESSDRWIAFLGVIICPLWFIYLIKFYDKNTQRKIEKALKIDAENNQKEALHKLIKAYEKEFPTNTLLSNATEQDMPTNAEKTLLNKYKGLTRQYSFVLEKLQSADVQFTSKIYLLIKKNRTKKRLLKIENSTILYSTICNLRYKEIKKKNDFEEAIQMRRFNRPF